MIKKLYMMDSKSLSYHSGFGAYVSSEALPGSLPKGQNNPQKCPYGLYAEQLSGTAFTKTRAKNQRTWLYRGRPSPANEWGHGYNMQPSMINWCRHVEENSGANSNEESKEVNETNSGVGLKSLRLIERVSEEFEADPNQMRWNAQEIPPQTEKVSFVEGITTIAKSGDECMKEGLAMHIYAFNAPMVDTCLSNSDGDFLIVPQTGTLLITTEFGKLQVVPNEICVIQRGMKYSVDIVANENGNKGARGYILEVFSGHFELPELGPIGSNGLANPRDFLSPTAAYDPSFPTPRPFVVLNKFGGKIFTYQQDHTPFDVVAFHGNYVPYKYDLRKFCCMNSVTYDHPDPSIYTVLTCPSNEPGVAVADFVVFPPRWCVMENSFRPPWFHRNTMSEYMGMIWGKYDAKTDGEGGFSPGGASLHQCMTPHGPDAATFDKASNEALSPTFYDKGLAFMFETTYIMRLSKFARFGNLRQPEYQRCWTDLKCNFDPNYIPENDANENLLDWRKSKNAAVKM